MRSVFSYFLKHYLYWIGFFIVFRVLFLASLMPFHFDAGIIELLQSLVAGLKLDISAASYLFIIPFLVLMLFPGPYLGYPLIIIRGYYRLTIFLVVTIGISNIILFRYWGTLLNNRALAFLAQPAEMLASVTNMQLLIMLLTLSLVTWFFIRIARAFVIHSFMSIRCSLTSRLTSLVLILPFTVVGIRGGLQLIPVNESSAVFSSVNTLNQVAINPVWFLGHNVYQSGPGEQNNYHWMDEQRAVAIVNSVLHKSENDSASVFNLSGLPNVVLILLESWTADIIEPLGGIPGVTPNFSKLSGEGLLFSSVYSSGFRTDQALVSVLSGFPAQPNNSIIRFADKVNGLPSLVKEFNKLNYQTSFYYGGELGFANMNNYLVSSGIKSIVSEKDFSADQRNSKWGAHDEFVLNRQLKDLEKSGKPFFSVLLTLSTHEPFEVPVATPFTGNSESEKFKKAAWYTDRCLGAYFDQAKKQPWYENTIFILMADHGHRLPLSRDYFDPRVRRMPVLIVSDLLKNEFQGKENATLAGQHNFTSTILRNLHMDDSDFNWSVNIMDPARYNFAYLCQDVAATWVTDDQTVIVPLQPGFTRFEGNEPVRDTAKAFIQELYRTFLNY